MLKTAINEELFNKVIDQMVYIEDQNNYEVNAVDLRYLDGQMYAESICVNEYGSVWSNEDYQEIDLDEELLTEVLYLMGEDYFVRIYGCEE